MPVPGIGQCAAMAQDGWITLERSFPPWVHGVHGVLAAVKFYHDDDDDDDDDDGGGCFKCCFFIASHGQYDLNQDSAAFEGVPMRAGAILSPLRVASCQSHPFSLTSATPALYCIS